MLQTVVRLASAMLLAVSLWLAPGLAGAQSPSKSRTELPANPEYEAAVKLGFEEFTLGNYVEARARFGEAHKLNPNARTLRALGMVEYELKRYVEAIDYLQQALSSTQRPLTSEQRAQTEGLLKQAHGYVARYRFSLTPAHAALTIDGVPVSGDPARGVLLAAGEHVVEASAEKYQSTRRTIQVLGGEEDHQLALMLLTQRAEPESQAPARDQPKRSRSKAWIWGTVGAVVLGGAIVGLVLGLRKDSDGQHLNTGTTGIEIPVSSGMTLGRR